MNETVKAALLRMRDRARSSIGIASDDVASLKRKLVVSEAHLEAERARLADIEQHLRDNDVDLAAVDVEAEKAWPKQSAQSSNLTQSYSSVQGAIGGLAQKHGTSRARELDPTAGLAKALSEA